MSGAVGVSEPGERIQPVVVTGHMSVRQAAVRPVGSTMALGLAVLASTRPLTAEGLGSATASATTLGLAWDSARTDLRIAAFTGASVFMCAALLTVMSVLPGTWMRRTWMGFALLYVFAMGLVVFGLGSNAGSAVRVLMTGAVVLCATIAVDGVVHRRERRSVGKGT